MLEIRTCLRALFHLAIQQHLDHSDGRGTAQRVATHGRAVVARLEGGGRRLFSQHSAHGQPAAQRLGQGKDIRLHAADLVAKQGAGASQAGLHLVKDQQDAVCIAQLAQTLQKFWGRGHYAALTLHGLAHYGCGLIGDLGLYIRQVVILRMHKACRHGAEGLLIFLLPGSRQRGQRAPVEGILHSDDLVPVDSLGGEEAPRQLDGALVGLRTGVGEERPVCTAVFHQQLG